MWICRVGGVSCTYGVRGGAGCALCVSREWRLAGRFRRFGAVALVSREAGKVGTSGVALRVRPIAQPLSAAANAC